MWLIIVVAVKCSIRNRLSVLFILNDGIHAHNGGKLLRGRTYYFSKSLFKCILTDV